MKQSCNLQFQRIVDLAEGQPDAEAQTHVSSCTACARELSWLQKFISSSSTEMWSAPSTLVELAGGLMAPTRRQRAKLVGGLIPRLAVRGKSEEIQVRFQAGSLSVRVLMIPESSGWRVIGRAEPERAQIVRALEILPTDEEGRFEFFANDLSETSLSIVLDGEWTDIPSAEQASSDEPR